MGIWIDGFTGFGLFTLITNFISIAGSKSKEHKENIRSFHKTYNPKTNTYLDVNCVECNPNGEYCCTRRDVFSGDLIQVDKNNMVIRNFSAEERHRETKKLGSTVLKMSERNIHTNKRKEIFGIRYTDNNTGAEYVIRWFKVNPYGMICFYMDTTTAHLIRMTDGEIKYGKEKNIGDINKFINEFNKKQDNCKKHIWEKFYNDADWVDLKADSNPLY